MRRRRYTRFRHVAAAVGLSILAPQVCAAGDPSASASREAVRDIAQRDVAVRIAQEVMAPAGIGGRSGAVAVSGSLALVAEGTHIRVVDITHIDAPLTVARSTSLPAVVQAVDMVASPAALAAVATGADGGLWLLDFQDPSEPRWLGGIDTPGDARDVANDGDLVYVADGPDGGLLIIDISDPLAPREIATLDTPGAANAIALAGGYVVVADGAAVRSSADGRHAGYSSGDVLVVDPRAPDGPAIVASLAVGGAAIAVAANAGRVVALVAESPPPGAEAAATFELFVIEVGEEPTIAGRVTLPDALTGDSLRELDRLPALAMAGRFAFVMTEVVVVVDTVPAEAPTVRRVLRQPLAALAVGSSRAVGTDPDGGFVSMLNGRGGVLFPLGGETWPGSVAAVAAGQRFAWAADRAGAWTIDVTSDGPLAVDAFRTTGGTPHDVVAFGGDGAILASAGVTTPTMVIEQLAADDIGRPGGIAAWTGSGNPAAMAIDGDDRLIVVEAAAPDGAERFRVLRLARPQPHIIAAPSGFGGDAVAVDGTRAAVGGDTLRLLDLADVGRPRETGRLNGVTTGVALAGDRGWALQEAELVAFDIDAEGVPEERARLALPGTPVALRRTGTLLAVSLGRAGALIIDTNAPLTEAAIRLRITTPGKARDAAVHIDADGRPALLIAAGDAGLWWHPLPPTFAEDVAEDFASAPVDGVAEGVAEIVAEVAANAPADVAAEIVAEVVANAPADEAAEVVAEAVDLGRRDGRSDDGASTARAARPVRTAEEHQAGDLRLALADAIGGAVVAAAVSDDGRRMWLAQGLRLVALDLDGEGRVSQRGSSAILSGRLTGLAHAGDILIGVGGGGLFVFDIGTGAAPNPRMIGHLPHYGARVVTIDGQRPELAWLASEGAGGSIVAVDLSDPAQPRALGRLDGSLPAAQASLADMRDLVASDGWLFVATGGDGVMVVDGREPTSPAVAAIVSALELGGPAHGLAFVGDRLAVAAGEAGVAIVDVATPASPTVSALVEPPADARGRGEAIALAARGDQVAVAGRVPPFDGDAGLWLVDLAASDEPAVHGGVSLAGRAEDVAIADGFAFLAAGSAGWRLIDVSQPLAPVVRAVGGAFGDAIALSGAAAASPWLADGSGAIVRLGSTPAEAQAGWSAAVGLTDAAVDVVGGDAGPAARLAGGQVVVFDRASVSMREVRSRGRIHAPNARLAGVPGKLALLFAAGPEDGPDMLFVDDARPSAPLITRALALPGRALDAAPTAGASTWLVATLQSGLVGLRLAAPDRTSLVRDRLVDEPLRLVDISGDIAWLVSADGHLELLDVQSPLEPQRVGIVHGAAEGALDLEATADGVWLARGDAGVTFAALSAADERAASQGADVLALTLPAPALDVAPAGDGAAWVAAGGAGLLFVKIARAPDFDGRIYVPLARTDSPTASP